MSRIELSETTHLRLLEESDAGELHALIEANRDHLARWLPWAAGQSPSDTLGFIRKTRRQLAGNNGFQLAVVQEGAIAGVIGYHAVDWENRKASIGYWLAEDRQGRGTMTEATRALVEHALSAWRLDRVEIRAAAENRRSGAIPERLGFRREATLHGAERVGERDLDMVVYSMTASEWGVSRSPARRR